MWAITEFALIVYNEILRYRQTQFLVDLKWEFLITPAFVACDIIEGSKNGNENEHVPLTAVVNVLPYRTRLIQS